MTDFRELCCELLAALAWVNQHKKVPDGFDELEARAAAALKAPPEIGLPLISAKQFEDAAEEQRKANAAEQQRHLDQYRQQAAQQQPPDDASPLVKYQRRMNEMRRRTEKHHRQIRNVPGAHWY